MRQVSLTLFLVLFTINGFAGDLRYNLGMDYSYESVSDTLNYPDNYQVVRSGVSYGSHNEALFFQVIGRKFMAGLRIQHGGLGINHYFIETQGDHAIMTDRKLDSGDSHDIRLGLAYNIKPMWYVGGMLFRSYVQRDYTTETPIPPHVIIVHIVHDSIYYGPELLTGVHHTVGRATFGVEVGLIPWMYRKDTHSWRNGHEGKFFIQSAKIVTTGRRLQFSAAIRAHRKASALVMYRLRNHSSPDSSFLIAEPVQDKIPESLSYRSFSVGIIFHM